MDEKNLPLSSESTESEATGKGEEASLKKKKNPFCSVWGGDTMHSRGKKKENSENDGPKRK